MTSRSHWSAVSSAVPCAICRKGDWCARSNDGELHRCERSNEAPAGYRAIKSAATSGTIFAADEGGAGRAPTSATRPLRLAVARPDFAAIHLECVEALSSGHLEELAAALKLAPGSLVPVGVGWLARENCWTVPERDGAGQIIGILRRYRNGQKKRMQGSRCGLVVPVGLQNFAGPVLIVEGPTDVAAAVEIGIAAVGRPSNSGGAELLVELLHDHDVVVVGEHDEKAAGTWPGRDGMERVARNLSKAWGRTVPTWLPPPGIKDFRELVLERRRDGKSDLEIRREVKDAVAIEAMPVGEAAVPLAEPITRGGLDVVCVADVQRREVQWLWPGRFPLGSVSVLGGLQGLGKSLVTVDMAARITSGRAWPDLPGAVNPIGSVVFLAAEDPVDTVVRPRLEAAGADLRRVHVVQGALGLDGTKTHFRIKHHVHQLVTLVRNLTDVRMIVVDPIGSYTGTEANSRDDASMRECLQPLVDLAHETGVAVILVAHLRKQVADTPAAVLRIAGSIAITALPRAVWMIGKDMNAAEDGGRVFLLNAKMNVARPAPGLAFEIVEGPSVRWEKQALTVTADSAFIPRRGVKSPSVDDAVEWLTSFLSSRGGSELVDVVQAAAKADCISTAALRKAREQVTTTLTPTEFGGKYRWALQSTISNTLHHKTDQD